MNLRAASGLGLVVAGLVLVPTAWASSPLLSALACVLVFVGKTLFYAERVSKREEELRREAVPVSAGRSAAGR